MTKSPDELHHFDILLTNRMVCIFKNNVLEDQGSRDRITLDHLLDIAPFGGSFSFHHAYDYDYLGEAIEYMGGLPTGIDFDSDALVYGIDLAERDEDFRDDLCLDEED